MKTDLLREKFLDFFKSKKHKIIESDSLVPKDDLTVLFTPAGMNQFKKEFMGYNSGFKRAATSQRCLRTDDLDKVGKTPCHHTFFEMLGNFSFGDYFKDEAISWAWEFLTKELEIDTDRLWVSVYKDDDEAYKIWKDKIKIPQDRIVKLGDKDNFWPAEAKQKGPNGPCGPCSEIFFDYGSDKGCREKVCDPSCSCGRFTEIWNLVFTQFNRKDGGVLEPLPNKNIDTGMGLERMAAVMQGVDNNFQTDLFIPIIREIELGISGVKAVDKKLIYAVADHIRAVVFAIYDGVLPSNEGRGYVIRKLIRRSTFNLSSLGVTKPFLYKLVPVVADIMKAPYPDLSKHKEDIAQLILAEENNFISILQSSDRLLKEKFADCSVVSDAAKSAKLTFELYDTYGLPVEITTGWLRKKFNVEVSRQELDKIMQEQKIRSKAKGAMKGDVFDTKDMDLGVKATKFVGYKNLKARAKILKILQNNTEIKKAGTGDNVKIVLDTTSFYPESGGQVGDTGEFVKGKNKFIVSDTKKIGKAIVHIGKVQSGVFKKGDALSVNVDQARRLSITRNHTATHLLQAALRKVLGAHVKQQGSLVSDDRFRFDFTHFKGLDKEQVKRIEDIVYGFVIGNYKVSIKQMSLSLAKKTGALAFFGEKYEEKVRVITIGDFSKEFCGGTHLDATGQIGNFKIIHEGSVASGVRRIEATTGTFALELMRRQEEELIQQLDKQRDCVRGLQKQLISKNAGTLQDKAKKIAAENKTSDQINGINVITAIQDNVDINSLRNALDMIKPDAGTSIIALGSSDTQNNRALLVIGLTADLVARGVDASVLIKDVAKAIGGSGGGRKDFAQAGGNRPKNFSQAFEQLKAIIGQIK